MRLRVFRQSTVDRLWDKTDTAEGIESYRLVRFEFAPDVSLESALEVGAKPALTIPSDAVTRAATDIDNAILLYDWLPNLSELQASDHRLWTCLAHADFPAYCLARWPLPEANDKARRSIREHWFVNGSGLAGLRRNALARLWWAARLTHAPWQWGPEFEAFRTEDAWAYLRVLLGNQDIYQGILERRYGSNRALLIAILDVIREDMPSRGTSAFVTSLAKQINLLCSFRELGVLPVHDLRQLVGALALGGWRVQ